MDPCPGIYAFSRGERAALHLGRADWLLREAFDCRSRLGGCAADIRLVLYERCTTRAESQIRLAHLRLLSPPALVHLIEQDNPAWRDRFSDLLRELALSPSSVMSHGERAAHSVR